MKMKEVESKKDVKFRLGRIVLVLGMVCFTVSCQKEKATPEYRNVAREISLTSFENAIKESGSSLERLIDKEQFIESHDRSAAGKSQDVLNLKVKAMLKPALRNSKELLYTYGITDNFLSREFNDPDDPRIVLAGLWLLSFERQDAMSRNKNRAQFLNFNLLAQENSLTEAQPDWMECMLIAVGVDAIVEFVKGNVTEAIAKKAIRKIASRTLGWVGVALALYEYGNCMGWY